VTVSHDTLYFGSVILSKSRRVALATVKEDRLEADSKGMNGVFFATCETSAEGV